MQRTQKLALAAAAALVAYAGMRAWDGPGSSAKDEDPAMILDRIWMEGEPDKPTDYLHGAYLLSSTPIGIFHRSSSYDFHFERFDFARKGGKIELTFPQSGKKAELGFTVKTCSERPPFDLCLDLSQNPWGGPKRYYGLRDQGDEAAHFGDRGAAIRARAAGR